LQEVNVPQRITIQAGTVTAEAELIENTISHAIWEALPINSYVNTWGDEIYFAIPVKVALENGQEVLNAGDIAYWPPGKALCVFFGPTPNSQGSEIRAASAVNVFGKLTGDPKDFSTVRDGQKISVGRA
jgi:hypothetical protein